MWLKQERSVLRCASGTRSKIASVEDERVSTVMTPELGKPPKPSPLTEEGRRTARRAFLTGSLAAAPLITTLASRPAWAGCGMISMWNSATHASHAGEYTCYGMPPEYWRMEPDMVDQYVTEVGPANPVDYKMKACPEPEQSPAN